MTEAKHKTVISEVVANDLCIGCGMCAGVCPRGNLTIAFNPYGEYAARMVAGPCPGECRLCLSVCPFFATRENEDTLGEEVFGTVAGMMHTPETGYYLEAFVGHSNVDGHRRHGASGGMATWMLETLLNEKCVDHIVCVTATESSEKLFEYAICSTAQEVRAGAGSCYYPVEMSQIIHHLVANDGRYAIVALPCFCKALRLAMKWIPALQRRVVYVAGLVCGQAKSKFFAEYACALGGGDPHHLHRVEFRVKDSGRTASDYGLKFVSRTAAGEKREGTVFQTQGVGRAWGSRYFAPLACGFCDDVFAETADVCFMDAWLPRYARDWKGHSIILVRRPELLEVVQASIENGSVSLRRLPIRAVIASQRSALRSKRGDINERIRMARTDNRVFPAKRLAKCNRRLSLVRKRLARAQCVVSQRSRRQWLASDKDLPKFAAGMRLWEERLRRLQILWKMWRAPGAVLRRLRNRVNR
jgi:coenzyme F420-reducing hydrogenase beta subunit